MNNVNETFKEITKETLNKGEEYTNKRRGVTRLQIPNFTFEHDMLSGFPALGLKKLPFKTVLHELIWFLNGSGDTTYLKENKVKIWDGDEKNWFDKTGEENHVGRNYGVQWRDYNGKVDQIKYLIKSMKKDIMGSRLIVSAWNPAELDKTALPPCHTFFQIIGIPNKGFELHWHQRSVDLFLGLPFNIASYAALGLILEKATGHKFLKLVGDLKCVHLYDNQFDAANELLNKDTNFDKVELKVNKVSEDLKNLNINDFELLNYKSHKAIKVDMIAPKSI